MLVSLILININSAAQLLQARKTVQPGRLSWECDEGFCHTFLWRYVWVCRACKVSCKFFQLSSGSVGSQYFASASKRISAE